MKDFKDMTAEKSDELYNNYLVNTSIPVEVNEALYSLIKGMICFEISCEGSQQLGIKMSQEISDTLSSKVQFLSNQDIFNLGMQIQQMNFDHAIEYGEDLVKRIENK